MNVSELSVARRLIRQVDAEGYLVGDKLYDANRLYDLAAEQGLRLVAPKRDGRGLGHHRHSPHRLGNLELTLQRKVADLSPASRVLGPENAGWMPQPGRLCAVVLTERPFGQALLVQRYDIDREDGFAYERHAERIAQEAALDGIYVIRTSLPAETLNAEQTVRAYKQLSTVERAFRSLRTVDLKVRPIFHRTADRVRAHVFLCMLAYYVAWHMRQALAPILLDDHDKPAGQALRRSVVAPAARSAKARRKAQTQRTEDDLPVHSFQTLLNDLATLTQNRHAPRQPNLPAFDKMTLPTPVQ